jgi:hypothetical protein
MPFKQTHLSILTLLNNWMIKRIPSSDNTPSDTPSSGKVCLLIADIPVVFNQ